MLTKLPNIDGHSGGAVLFDGDASDDTLITSGIANVGLAADTLTGAMRNDSFVIDLGSWTVQPTATQSH